MGLLARCARPSLLQILRSPGKQSHCGTRPQAASSLLDLPVRYSPGPRHRFTGVAGSGQAETKATSRYVLPTEYGTTSQLGVVMLHQGQEFLIIIEYDAGATSPELGPLNSTTIESLTFSRATCALLLKSFEIPAQCLNLA